MAPEELVFNLRDITSITVASLLKQRRGRDNAGLVCPVHLKWHVPYNGLYKDI